jgi:acyl-CoA synthetase (AMP-forming)/AMP-acid ligase II
MKSYKDISFLNKDLFLFPDKSDWSDFIDILEFRAAEQSNRSAIGFYYSKKKFELHNYSEFWQKISKLSEQIQSFTDAGDRVLILLQPGMHYMLTFFASMHAGCIPVPLYPPLSKDSASVLINVIANCQPAIVITSKVMFRMLKYGGTLSKIPFVGKKFKDFTSSYHQHLYEDAKNWFIAEDLINGAHYNKKTDLPQRRRCDIAFLMYTSGSTSTPKGVIVKHENYIANIFQIASGVAFTPDSRGINWVPPFHDMGLIGTVSLPLLLGFETNTFSPMLFLKDPLVWLELISADRRAHIATSPNFGYELLIKKYDESRCQKLDLSNMRFSLNGAEPIRQSTLEKFISLYEKHGFKSNFFFPCYGLAEGTVYISGASYDREKVISVSKEGLNNHKILPPQDGKNDVNSLVSCGKFGDGIDIIIIDPDTNHPLQEKEIGEIIFRGPNSTTGYWKSPDATQALKIKIDDKEYIKTGDFGFLFNGNLYVSGRIKDLIIIRGKNHYPQDIEEAVQEVDKVIRKGCVAAVPLEASSGTEGLGVIAEVYPEKIKNYDVLANAINSHIYDLFQISIDELVLIPPKKILKTTSGKLQRSKNSEKFLLNPCEDIVFKKMFHIRSNLP